MIKEKNDLYHLFYYFPYISWKMEVKKSILEKNLDKIYRKQKLLYVMNHKRLRKVIKQLKCFYPFICVIIFSILNLLL